MINPGDLLGDLLNVVVSAEPHALAANAGATVAAHLLAGVTDKLSNAPSDKRFAIAKDQMLEEMVWLQQAVLCEVVRHLYKKELSEPETYDLLSRLASDPRFRHHFFSLQFESFKSNQERIAMLATAYFVGTSKPTIQDRINMAIPHLLPADADTLGKVIEAQTRFKSKNMLLCGPSGTLIDEWAICEDGVALPPIDSVSVSRQSLDALLKAGCVDFSGMSAPGNIVIGGGSPAFDTREIAVKPLGYELDAVLKSVDWVTIATQKKAKYR